MADSKLKIIGEVIAGAVAIAFTILLSPVLRRWYSHDLLNNGGVPGTDRIIPEYQRLAVKDKVLAISGGRLAFPVVAIEPDRTFALGWAMAEQSYFGLTLLGASPLVVISLLYCPRFCDAFVTSLA